MAYQLILFDIDGTLIDSFAPYQKIMQAILPQFNRQASTATLRQTFAMSVDQELAALDLPAAQKPQMLAAYAAETQRAQYPEPIYPGIAELLPTLKQRQLALGVVTARNRADLPQLDPNQFLAFMTVVITADDLPYQKPDPRPLLTAAQKVGIPVAQTLYIGDAPSDAQAARAAKMDFGAALWGAAPGVTFPGAKYQLTQPKDILTLF